MYGLKKKIIWQVFRFSPNGTLKRAKLCAMDSIHQDPSFKPSKVIYGWKMVFKSPFWIRKLWKAEIWTEYSYDLVVGPIRFSVAQGKFLGSQDTRIYQNQAIYTIIDHQNIITSNSATVCHRKCVTCLSKYISKL